MRIITNADDFGYDADTVQATIECFAAGYLTGATIMPGMPAAPAAIAYAQAHPENSFGVHLTYVCDTVEAPLAPPGEVPALLRPDGRFLPSQTVRKKALLGLIPVAQIARETAAQIGFLHDHGIAVSHVDSHGHLHKFAPFRRALQEVLPRFGIRKVRGVQDLYLRKPLKSPTFWFGPLWRRSLARHFVHPDHFYMPAAAGDVGWGPAILKLARGGTLEVGVHPGRQEDWRNRERLDLEAFVLAARAAGHVLIGWREL